MMMMMIELGCGRGRGERGYVSEVRYVGDLYILLLDRSIYTEHPHTYQGRRAKMPYGILALI